MSLGTARLRSLSVLSNRFLCPSSLVPARGKKKAAKKQQKDKDKQKNTVKDYYKQLEVRKVVEEYIVKLAKKGEPLDPEMLNPARKRDITELKNKEKERQVLLMKEWAGYKMKQHMQDLEQLKGMMQARERALRELRKLSIPLYNQSLMLRKDLFPFKRVGPVATPPKEGYEPPEPENLK